MPKSVFTDAYADLIGRLIALRKNAGVSQVELSQRIGKQQAFVSNIERGVRRLDLIEFCVIVRALGGDPVKMASDIAAGVPRDLTI